MFIRDFAKHGVEIRVSKNKNEHCVQRFRFVRDTSLVSVKHEYSLYSIPVIHIRGSSKPKLSGHKQRPLCHPLDLLAQKCGSAPGCWLLWWHSSTHSMVFTWQVTLDRTKPASPTHLSTWKRWGKAQLGWSAKAPTPALSNRAISEYLDFPNGDREFQSGCSC